MPLAPPVTTTILPVTCITASAIPKISGHYEIEHGGVVAARSQQHEGMPDRVLKSQPLPGMKDDPETVEQAAGHDKPHGQGRQQHQAFVVDHEPAPAHPQINPDRTPA